MKELIAWDNVTVCKNGMIDVDGKVSSMTLNNKEDIDTMKNILIQKNDGILNLDGESTYLFSRISLKKLTYEPIQSFINSCLNNNIELFYLDIV